MLFRSGEVLPAFQAIGLAFERQVPGWQRVEQRTEQRRMHCGACGICAGACPSATPFRSVAELVSGIDLPDFTVHDLRRKLQAALPADEVLFSCEKSGAGGIALRCLAMLPPSFVEYALRGGADGVLVAGQIGRASCRERVCSVV